MEYEAIEESLQIFGARYSLADKPNILRHMRKHQFSYSSTRNFAWSLDTS